MVCKGALASCTVKQLLRSVLLFVVPMMALSGVAQTQTATSTTFSLPPGPVVSMLQAGDGNFYALSMPSNESCQNNDNLFCSYIYRIAPDGTTSVFHAFQPVTSPDTINSDGFTPVALIVGTDGNFYGACKASGPGGFGTIFKITPAGEFSLLKSFGLNSGTINGVDLGYEPNSLLQGADGNFYFTNGIGVYELTFDGGSVTTISTFPFDGLTQTASMGTNASSIMQGIDGSFYLTMDTTPGIGVGHPGVNAGAIDQLTLNGQLSVLHSFAVDGSEGVSPGGPLVQGRDGFLYGVTQAALTSTNVATAFKVSTNGTFILLHTFPAGVIGNRSSALFLGSDGNFYGATMWGGDTTSELCALIGCGTAYQMTPSGTLTTLHNFEGGLATDIPDPDQ